LLRLEHNAAVWEEVLERWNNLKDTVCFLVTTVRVGGLSINLHKACNVLVMPEMISSLQSIIQVLGRIDRTGSKGVLHSYILSVNNTIHDVFSAQLLRKKVTLCVADNPYPGNDNISKDMARCLELRARHQTIMPMEWIEKHSDQDKVKYFYASQMIQQFLGHRAPRDHWFSMDFHRRNKLPGEKDCEDSEEMKDFTQSVRQAMDRILHMQSGNVYDTTGTLRKIQLASKWILRFSSPVSFFRSYEKKKKNLYWRLTLPFL
jgi:hypothetical protein